MLSTRRTGLGFTLVELMVTVTVLTLVLLMSAPSFSAWMRNIRLRSSAESVLAGLQFAKAEAVGRNSLVRFQFTDTMDNSCALSTTSGHWVVNADPLPNTVVGACGASPSNTVSPFIVRKQDGTNGPTGMVVSSNGVNTVTFNGLGRPVAPVNVNVDFMIQNAANCAASGGPVTCLRVVVSAAGEVRMCNPKFALPDPQGC